MLLNKRCFEKSTISIERSWYLYFNLKFYLTM